MLLFIVHSRRFNIFCVIISSREIFIYYVRLFVSDTLYLLIKVLHLCLIIEFT
jgi:hypothetical protein